MFPFTYVAVAILLYVLVLISLAQPLVIRPPVYV